MSNMKKITAIIIIIFTIFFLTACNNQKQDTIKIGVIGTMTGFGSYQGKQELNGLNLAKEEINTKGGINGKKIQFIIEDSQANPAKAVTAIHKLVNIDKVKFVIGDSWSSTTVALVPITNRTNTILISPIALLDELSQDDLFFRTIPTTKEMMKVLADHAFNKMNVRKVAIIHQETSFGHEHATDFTNEFTKLGGQIVAQEGIDLKQTNLRAELIRVKSKNPDTIFNLHATGPSLGIMMKQAKELGINVQWISSFGAQNAPLVKEFGETVEGLTYPYPYDMDSSNQSTKDFIRKYQTKYNELPDLTAANSYDILRILIKAIEQKGSNPQDIKQFLLEMPPLKGASGELHFDKNGDVQKTIFIKQIKNSKFIKAI